MLGVAILLIGLVDPLPPTGPYHRTHTYATWCPEPIVFGNEMYVKDDNSLRCVDLPVTERWRNTKDVEGFADLAVHPKWTIVSRREFEGISEIVGLNRQTGEAEWRLPADRGTGLMVAGDTLYASPKAGEVQAINLSTRKTIWAAKLGKDERLDVGALSGKQFLVGTTENSLHVLDAQTGKALWTRPDTYFLNDEVTVSKGIFAYSADEGLAGIDVATGKQKWLIQRDDIFGIGATDRGFAGYSSNKVFGFDAATGDILWSHDIAQKDGWSSNDGVRMFQGRILVQLGAEAMLLEPGGAKAWSISEDDSPGVLFWTDGKTAIFDGRGIFAMEAGGYPTLPAEPAARGEEAQKLLRDFAVLSDNEIERLTSLGDDAFPAVLKEYLRLCAIDDTELAKDKYYDTMTTYELGHVLEEISGAKWAQELGEAYDSLTEKQSARATVGQLYAKYGDEKSKVVKFIDLLNRTDPSTWARGEDAGTALGALANSSDPKAVEFMIGILKDAEMPSDVREGAYLNLARTGGETGLAAVLAEQWHDPRPLPSLEERMKLDEVGPKTDRRAPVKLLGEFTDAARRTWGLVTSDVLGNKSDLWIVERVDGRWTRPVFSGIHAEPLSRWFSEGTKATLDGKTGAQIASGAWKTVLVGRESLFADQDRDGLTDLVEKRLGTKLDNGDTDGDGRGDAVDGFPTTAPRTLTEEEQILATAWEAHYHFNGDVSPAVASMPEGKKAFEVPGWKGPVLWNGQGPVQQLQEHYENGVAFIRIQVQEEPRTPEQVRDQIYGVEISTYYGGLNGTGYLYHVRKFGERFVVIDERMQYIS